MRYFSALCARMYRFRANSRATISSTAIFLSQQSRQYFSSPRGSDTSLAPHSAHRDFTTDLRGMEPSVSPRNVECKMLQRPSHRGLRHLALGVRELDAMKRFYVDLLGFDVEWEPDADNVYLSSGIDNLALHRASIAAPSPTAVPPAASPPAVSPLDHLGLIVREAEDVDRWAAFLETSGVVMDARPRTH